MGEVIVITSGKGGVGKSTISSYLGVMLAGQGRQCVLVDVDMGLRSLDLMLGMEHGVVYDLADVADGTCSLKQALIAVPGVPGLSFVAAAQTRDSGSLTALEMEDITGRLAARFDYVLIDCPAGIGRGFRNAVAGAHSALLVSTPDAVAMRDAQRVIGLLEQRGVQRPRLIVNRVERLCRETVEEMRAYALAQEIELIGLVMEDRQIARNVGHPERFKHTPAGDAIERIARRILGEEVPIPRADRGNRLRRGANWLRTWLDGENS